MMSAIWFDLGEGQGVLELQEFAGWAAELHVVIDSETSRTIAWWENDSGAWLRTADVGAC